MTSQCGWQTLTDPGDPMWHHAHLWMKVVLVDYSPINRTQQSNGFSFPVFSSKNQWFLSCTHSFSCLRSHHSSCGKEAVTSWFISVERSQTLPTPTWISLEADPSIVSTSGESQDETTCQGTNCLRDLDLEATSQGMPQFLTHRNCKTISAHYLKTLSFRVISYVTQQH